MAKVGQTAEKPQCAAGAGITRRQFFTALAGAGALSVGGVALLGGCTKKDATAELLEAAAAGAPDASATYLDVPEGQVSESTEMSDAEPGDYIKERSAYDLPSGCLLYQDSDNHVLVLQSNAGLAKPATGSGLVTLRLLSLADGSLSDLMAGAKGETEDYVIYDARANDRVVIWVECHLISGNWRVYGAALNGTTLGTESLLDEGDELYEPPLPCVCESSVYWAVMPDPEKEASSEDTYLKRSRLSSGQMGAPEQVYVSHGRLSTGPQASDGLVTLVPRVDTDSVIYQLTTLRDSDSAVCDVAVLPPSLRVSDAVYMAGGFSFCIEGNYDYAGGLSKFGTYGLLSDGRIFHANKTPTSPAMSMAGCIYIKSTKNIIGFDVANSRYFVVETPKECVDYGDVLAGCGSRNTLVTYTTIINKFDVAKSTTRVRVFEPA